MATKRKRYSAAFKTQVALEAIRGELTVAQLAAKHGIHQTMINGWKKQATEGLTKLFAGKTDAAATAHDAEVEKLHCPRSASWW
jgi:transposase